MLKVEVTLISWLGFWGIDGLDSTFGIGEVSLSRGQFSMLFRPLARSEFGDKREENLEMRMSIEILSTTHAFRGKQTTRRPVTISTYVQKRAIKTRPIGF